MTYIAYLCLYYFQLTTLSLIYSLPEVSDSVLTSGILLAVTLKTIQPGR